MEQEQKKHTAALMDSDKVAYEAFATAHNAGAGSSSSSSYGPSNIPFDFKVVDYEEMGTEAIMGNPFQQYSLPSLPKELHGTTTFKAKEFESMFSDDLRIFLEERGLGQLVNSGSHVEEDSPSGEAGEDRDGDNESLRSEASEIENLEGITNKDLLSKQYYKLVSEINSAAYMHEYERLNRTFDYLVHFPPGSSIAIAGKCELVRGKNITVIEDAVEDEVVMRTDGSNVPYDRIRVTFALTFNLRVNINKNCNRSPLVLRHIFFRPQDYLKFRNRD